MQGIRGFFAELQKRHVIRAAAAHVLVFWLLIQVADVLLPYIGIDNDPVRWALVIGIATFPVTLVVAWLFEHPWQRYTRSRIAVDAVVILVIGVIAVTWVGRNIPQVVHARTSIVILPFEHSGDPVEEGLSRALALEVNSLLLRSRSIDVIAFESAVSSVLQGLEVTEVAERLDVEHVLAGSIATSGDSLRVDMTLANRVGDALLKRALEESLENLFNLQERIAWEVESRLGVGDGAVSIAQVAAERCPMPTDPEALEKYYTARYYVELRTDSDISRQQLRDAIALYQDLIEVYPDFAEAYSGLAWALAHQPGYDPQNALPDWRERGEQLAIEALGHCPKLTEAIHWLPNEYDHDKVWIGSYQQLTAFIQMEPHRAENYQRLARVYRETGRPDRAVAIAEQNFAMNPLSPKAAKILSSVYQYAERYDEAIELAELAADLGNTGPNFARATKHMSECDRDIKCILAVMPPPFQQLEPAFESIYADPVSADEAQAAIDLALELTAENPNMLLNWFTGSLCGFEHLTPLFFELWERHEAFGAYWFWPNVWMSGCENVWSAPRFPGFVEEQGFVEFWDIAGWPTMCRRDGENVVCGDPTRPKRR